MIKGSRIYPEIIMTQEMLDAARVKEEEIPETIKNSVRKGHGRFAGCVGEVAFEKYSNGEKCNTYNFDVCLQNGKVCEIKTKERGEKPKSTYEASIFAYNTRQECDYYIFASTLHDYSKVWLLGWLTPEEFKKIARFRKEGDVDPSNGQKCPADCWNVYIFELHELKDLPNEQKKKKEVGNKKNASKKNRKAKTT